MDYISNENEAVAIEEKKTDVGKDTVIAYGKCIASAKADKQNVVSERKQSIRDRLK